MIDVKHLFDSPLNPDKDTTQNSIQVMPAPYRRTERIQRTILNSAAFDRASYAADGGDEWIDDRRELFFQNPKQPEVWKKAEAAAKAAGNGDNWKFIVWMYRKLGGTFH